MASERAYRVLLTTVPGLEEVVVGELREMLPELLSKAEYRELTGRVYAEVERSVESLERLHSMKSIERVMLVAYERRVAPDSLPDEEELARELEILRAYLRPPMTFMVRAQRIGEHEYSSLDISRLVGGAVQSITESEVSLSDPDLVVHAEVVYDTMRICIDLTGLHALHKRGYKVYVHPSSLNPIIAHAMCRLAGVSSGDRVLDPMCGSGTILIECKLYASGVEAYGVDIDPAHLEGAARNAARAGVGRLHLRVGDVLELDSMFPEEFFDAVITNPPFGIRERSPYGIAALYRALVEKSSVVLKEGGRMCVLTPRRRTLCRLLEERGFELERVVKVRHGGLTSCIIVGRKVNKSTRENSGRGDSACP